MKDFFDREINIGDYIVYSQLSGRSKINTFVAKVVDFNNNYISITSSNYWNHRLATSYIKIPERCVIISEELALMKESRLRDV